MFFLVSYFEFVALAFKFVSKINQKLKKTRNFYATIDIASTTPDTAELNIVQYYDNSFVVLNFTYYLSSTITETAIKL